MKGRFTMDGSDRMSFDRNYTSLNRRLILIVQLRLIRVHRRPSISTIITGAIDGHD